MKCTLTCLEMLNYLVFGDHSYPFAMFMLLFTDNHDTLSYALCIEVIAAVVEADDHNCIRVMVYTHRARGGTGAARAIFVKHTTDDTRVSSTIFHMA